jgi:hypothetical protein
MSKFALFASPASLLSCRADPAHRRCGACDEGAPLVALVRTCRNGRTLLSAEPDWLPAAASQH